jgi:hypothetical protein
MDKERTDYTAQWRMPEGRIMQEPGLGWSWSIFGITLQAAALRTHSRTPIRGRESRLRGELANAEVGKLSETA